MDTLATRPTGRVHLNPDRLKRAMVARGVTERELADLAGISVQTLYCCLAGRPIAARTEARIVRALNSRKPLAVAADLLEEAG